MATIARMLEQSGLPTADLANSQPEFVVLEEATTGIVAAGALEHFGTVALLRSVVVADDHRGAGLGATLVAHLEARARERGVADLVLLTQTAESFFSHRGYEPVPRTDVAASLQTTAEFRSLCPDSARCMLKHL